MRAIGHGIDLVEVDRLAESVDMDWLARCFDECEIANIPAGPTRASYIAGRFAAKEAALKALGTGQGDGISFSDVIIERTAGEPPTIRLVDGAQRAADARGVSRWLLSISHTGSFAMASAIAFTE